MHRDHEGVDSERGSAASLMMELEGNMNSWIGRLVEDDRGATAPMGVILVTSILSLGAIVGLTTVRDHIVQQFGDTAVALRELRQSYYFSVAIDKDRDGDPDGPDDCLMTGEFTDTVDLVDASGAAPACLNLTIAPIDEGG